MAIVALKIRRPGPDTARAGGPGETLLGPEATFVTGADPLIDGGVIAALCARRIALAG